MADKFLKVAIDLAKLSKCQQKHGAILVKNGQVLAAGTNLRLQTVTDTNWRASSLHAEEHVISLAGSEANGATLYVARVNARGEVKLSLPCARCRNRIYRRKIRRVITT